MNTGHARFNATHQHTLAYRYFLPDLPSTQIRASVVLLHGWGDHSGRYTEQAATLCSAGYAVYVPDFYGHGLSPGPRAKVHVFQCLIDDVHALLEHLQPPAPVFLCGHSMGGCVAFHFSLQHPERLRGVIFNSAALTVNPKIPAWKRYVARHLGRILPHAPVSHLKYADMMSQLAHEQQHYAQDTSIYHGKIDAGTGLALMEANDNVERHMTLLTLPFLALQGSDDVLVNPAGPELLMKYAAASDKTLHRFAGMRHELLHEPVKHEVLTIMLNWLDQRTGCDENVIEKHRQTLPTLNANKNYRDESSTRIDCRGPTVIP